VGNSSSSPAYFGLGSAWASADAIEVMVSACCLAWESGRRCGCWEMFDGRREGRCLAGWRNLAVRPSRLAGPALSAIKAWAKPHHRPRTPHMQLDASDLFTPSASPANLQFVALTPHVVLYLIWETGLRMSYSLFPSGIKADLVTVNANSRSTLHDRMRRTGLPTYDTWWHPIPISPALDPSLVIIGPHPSITPFRRNLCEHPVGGGRVSR